MMANHQDREGQREAIELINHKRHLTFFFILLLFF